MKKLKLLLMSFTVALLAALMPATLVLAAPTDSSNAVCEGVSFTNGGTCDTAAAASTIPKVVNLAIRILQMIVGIISVFTLITAGLGYITSGGDSAKTKTAKDRIMYSAIGLMVVVLAEVIVRFVLNRVESVV